MLPWDQQKNNLQITNRIQSEKAPFKWAGGKNRMFKKYWASGFFPESEEPDLFVDMFAGSACVARWVKTNYPNTSIVLNEGCEELVLMYQHMKKKQLSSF